MDMTLYEDQTTGGIETPREKRAREAANKSLTGKLRNFAHALAKPNQLKPTAELSDTMPDKSFAGVLKEDNRLRPRVFINARYGRNPFNSTAPLKFEPGFNQVLAHEVGHLKQDGTEPDLVEDRYKDDLMYEGLDTDEVTKESLAKKIRKRALFNLEQQEAEMGLRVPRKPGEVRPIPVRQMYENIEKNVPPEKKHYWWSERIP